MTFVCNLCMVKACLWRNNVRFNNKPSNWKSIIAAIFSQVSLSGKLINATVDLSLGDFILLKTFRIYISHVAPSHQGSIVASVLLLLTGSKEILMEPQLGTPNMSACGAMFREYNVNI